jgi:hypothetical protein
MGTWGVNSFDNDNAADWVWELEEADDLSVVEEAIERVLDCGDELVESPDAEVAIAAADVLARLKAGPACKTDTVKAPTNGSGPTPSNRRLRSFTKPCKRSTASSANPPSY